MDEAIRLVVPTRERLPQFLEALHRGWSPNNERPQEAAREILDAIEEDADAFLARQVDPEGRGPAVTLPDGSKVPRLPGMCLWVDDGDFCGIANFRWQEGTPALPPYVLGHIGYSIVPWKRRRGYATQALRLMLAHARERGMPYVELTCNPDNHPSRKVIEANGGVFVEEFVRPPQQGGTPGLRFRIELTGPRRA